MNTIINTALNSQSSSRDKNGQLAKVPNIDQIKYDQKDDELRLSMLGLEISDPNVFGGHKRTPAQDQDSSRL